MRRLEGRNDKWRLEIVHWKISQATQPIETESESVSERKERRVEKLLKQEMVDE